jgi:NADP-dependent 3-hydroxy acid dehydrogenase YdfG
MIFSANRDVDILDDEDDSTAMDKIEEVIQTNWTGLVHVTRKAYHLMEKMDDFGIIINIGSISSHSIPSWYFKFNVYAGTKVSLLEQNSRILLQEFLHFFNSTRLKQRLKLLDKNLSRKTT